MHLGRRVMAKVHESKQQRDADASDAVARWHDVLAQDIALERSDWCDEFYAMVASGGEAQ